MKRSKETGDFASGSVYGHILRLAVPLTIAQLVHLLYSIVDRIYIGHLPVASSEALTGLGLTFPIVSLISAFTNLFSLGGAPLSSISRGRGDDDEAERIMGNTFTCLILSSAVLFILFNAFMRPLLYLFGAGDVTYVYAAGYLKIYLIGTPFVMIGVGMNQFITSQGFGRMGMITITAGALFNIILDPILIFVFDMGIAGAAIASVASQLLSALLVVSFLTGKRTILRIKKDTMGLERKRVLRIMGLGMSGFVMQATNSAVQMTASSTLHIFGGDLFVGLMTVFNSVRDIFSLPASGLTDGGKPVIGFNYGAGKFDRVKKSILFMTVTGIAYMVLAWLILISFPEFFIRIFSSDPSFISTGPAYLKMYYFGFFFMAFQNVGQSTFVGMGRSKIAIFFSVFRKIIIVVPLTIILPRLGLGVSGVFIAEPISNFIGGLACYITMAISTRKLFEKESALRERL